MRNKVRFGLKQHDWKFRDLIKFLTNLINQIKGLIEKISKIGVNWGQNCNRLNSKN
jgi:hypothetical protein